MSGLGVMDGSPRGQRVAIAAGVGIGTAGLLVGVLLLGPLAASVLLVVVFALIWPLAATIRHVADDVPFQSPVLVASCAAGAVLCVPGVVRLLAWGAVGFAVMMVAAAVGIVFDLVMPQGSRPKRRHQPAYKVLSELSRTEQAQDEKMIASLQCPLSIEELCGVWCETVTTLAEGAGARDRQAVAEVRRICLDEFERRNPVGFNRWIAAGAPADPGNYLLPEPETGGE